MHEAIAIALPLIAILAGILFSRSDIKELRTEMNTRFAEMNKRLDKVDEHLGRIDADLRQFYHLTGKLEARMDNIEKR